MFQCVRPFNCIKIINDTLLLQGATTSLQSEMENRMKVKEKRVEQFERLLFCLYFTTCFYPPRQGTSFRENT
jgi:hypothetical protein